MKFYTQDQEAFSSRVFKIFNKYGIKYFLSPNYKGSCMPQKVMQYRYGDESECFGYINFYYGGGIEWRYNKKSLNGEFVWRFGNCRAKPNFKKKACYLGKYISKRIINDCLE